MVSPSCLLSNHRMMPSIACRYSGIISTHVAAVGLQGRRKEGQQMTNAASTLIRELGLSQLWQLCHRD